MGCLVFVILIGGGEFGLNKEILMRAFVVLDVQREEKNVHKAIKEAAKRNDMGSAKVNYQTSY